MQAIPRNLISLVTLVLSMAVTHHATAESPTAPPVIEYPPSSAGGDPDAELAPEITITERGETTIEEYRLNGQLYMIKIVPKKGVPYYLVDSNGDGLSRRFNDLSPGFLIPSWVLLRWR